jgi:hypothetical protein
MSILRLAFWLGLIVLLLPTDAQQQERFSSFARSALERISTFCDRNGKTCTVGGDVWSTVMKKAEFGIRLVGDLLGAGARQTPEMGPPGRPQGPYRPPQRPYYYGPPQGTYRGPDKRGGWTDPGGTPAPTELYQPPWRGPGRPGG